jgi:phosphatidylserine/phosphatidylglycerophosphate/cardiolipin synthase-like enzyme
MARRPYASVYFSPRRGTDDAVIGFIDRCDQTLDVAVYAITHDGIAEALIRAHQRGVTVRVIMDKLQASSRYADDEQLAAAGIPVKLGIPGGLMHWKTAIGDSQAVGTGSFNWTASAEERNAENWLIVRLKYLIEAFQREFDAIWNQLEGGPDGAT